jgi:hypothetical protein
MSDYEEDQFEDDVFSRQKDYDPMNKLRKDL